MTDLLIRLFVRDHEKTEQPKVRASYGRLSGLVGIVCNLILFAIKLLAGTLSGSVSIVADAVNNLTDASSSVISLLGFKMASKPADPKHPYGHARYEYLSGLLVSVLILVIGVELFQSSLDKILHPTPVEFSAVIAVILVASIALKLWMSLFNRKLGTRIHSQTLLATSADSRNDVISTTAVLVAAVLSFFLKINLDGWMGVAVAVFILYSGIGLVRETLDPLLGRAPEEDLVQRIHDKVMTYPNVLGTHDLIVHDYGPGRQFASIHVEMPAENDILESHDVTDNIERDFLLDENIHLVVHLDPIVTSDSLVGEIRTWLAEAVRTIDPILSIHDLRIVPGPTHTNLIFDCVTPAGFRLTEDELRHRIGTLVTEYNPQYFCVITFDIGYAAIPS